MTFTHSHIIPNLCDFLSTMERCGEICLRKLQWGAKLFGPRHAEKSYFVFQRKKKKTYMEVIKSLQNIYLILDFFNSADGSSGHASYPVLCSRGSADANGHQGCHREAKDQGRVHLSAKEQIMLSYIMFNCIQMSQKLLLTKVTKKLQKLPC